MKASAPVKRTSSGAIDIRYYERRIRRLRARWMHMVVRRLIGKVVAGLRRSALRNELQGLDDRALRDIGVSRGDIPAIVSGTFTEDATRRGRAGIDVVRRRRPDEAGGW